MTHPHYQNFRAAIPRAGGIFFASKEARTEINVSGFCKGKSDQEGLRDQAAGSPVIGLAGHYGLTRAQRIRPRGWQVCCR